MLGTVRMLELGGQPTRNGTNETFPTVGAGPVGEVTKAAGTGQGRVRPGTSLAGRLLGPGVPRRTVRMRLALAYGALFLVCGAALLGISYFFVARFPFASTIHITPPAHVRSAGSSSVVHLLSPSNIPSSPGPKAPPPGSGVNGNSVLVALRAQHSADLHTLLVWFGVALGVMAVVSVLLGWVMGGRVLRPLRRITATARHISEANLHQRLAFPGPSDEITDLADTVDGLLGRLEGAFDAQRSFVANASHELRTPLAMMRTSLDVAAAKSPPISTDASILSAKVREGLDQAERLVESFLVFARAERGVIDDPSTVSLPQAADHALAARADVAAASGVALRPRLDQAGVTGSDQLLARLAGNLVDNAIRYNQPGGWVEVTTSTEGPSARLIVENTGRTLDPDEVRQLDRPFRRGGTERTCSDGGVGLGLSIVAAITAAHHGTVDLQGRPGGGLRVVVTLPRSVDLPSSSSAS